MVSISFSVCVFCILVVSKPVTKRNVTIAVILQQTLLVVNVSFSRKNN